MTPNFYNKPRPVVDPDSKGFWEHALHHRLVVQQCLDCGDKHFPPGPVCPNCLCDQQQWLQASGKAKLVSWVNFHRAYWDGYRDELPYNACLVQLEEGPLMVSNLVGRVPESFRVGMPLRVVFDDLTDDFSLPVFVAEQEVAA
jgi:uncharacterized OB-fold protein